MKLKLLVFVFVGFGVSVLLLAFNSKPRHTEKKAIELPNEIGNTSTYYSSSSYEINSPGFAKEVDRQLPKTHSAIATMLPFPRNKSAARDLAIKGLLDKKDITSKDYKFSSIQIKWYGRLGNNIIQVSNAVYLAELMNVSTIYVDPGFCRINNNVEIKEKNITIIPTKNIPSNTHLMDYNIFQFDIDNHNPDDRVLTFASEVLKGIPHVNTSDDELYIHIRSGDIFSHNPCPYYGQPPLCFYESIIKKWGFKKIFILTDSAGNPVIEPLRVKYGAKMMMIDLETTIGYILSARNLVVSFGTFVPALLRLIPDDPSKRIFRYSNRFWYCTDIWKKMVYLEPSKNYVDKILSVNWANTKEQREMMINEKCDDDWKISLYTTYKEWEDEEKATTNN